MCWWQAVLYLVQQTLLRLWQTYARRQQQLQVYLLASLLVLLAVEPTLKCCRGTQLVCLTACACECDGGLGHRRLGSSVLDIAGILPALTGQWCTMNQISDSVPVGGTKQGIILYHSCAEILQHNQGLVWVSLLLS